MVDLKELRNKVGLTQQELADEVGVSVNTIQNWENGKTVPKGDNSNQYFNALGIKDPNERRRIIGELSVIECADEADRVDNVPHFLFSDNSYEITHIMNCYASAEELDMLGYFDYVSARGVYAKRERRGEERYLLEFSFFEKYGGYNATRKKIADAQERLGSMYYDALEYAEKNPGCEYCLSAFDETVIIDKIGAFLGKTDFKKEIYDIYECLKTIDAFGTQFFSITNMQVRADREKEIKGILYQYANMIGDRNLGRLTGYVEIISANQNGVPGIENLRLTDRGKQLIQWYEDNNNKYKTVV